MTWNVSNVTTMELGNGMTLSVQTLRTSLLQLASVTTTGIGITALGANAPAGLLSLSIGGWAKVTLSNGSTGYIPVWV